MMTTAKREVLDLNDVRRILDSHLEYLSTNGSNGAKADFSFYLIEGADFSGLDLGDVYFQESILIRCRFHRAVLAECHFSRTLAPMTSFDEANLIKAEFYCADLSESSFSQADLTGTDFQKCNLRRAVLARAKVRGTSILNSDLTDAALPRATPSQLTLVDCEGARR
jgi:uncharacterized protein YjbI with pentapeptide repeats